MADVLNIISICVVAYRLAPFIFVSFFTLSSVLNQDLKGVIYLIGLIISTFIAVMVSNSGIISFADTSANKCSPFTLLEGKLMSNIPLSQVVFSYTFSYLAYVIIKYKYAASNIPLLLLFPALIMYDIYHNVSATGCTTWPGAVSGLFIGGIVGSIWASIIDSTKITKLQYYTGISNRQTCSIPSKQTFRCTQKKLDTANS